MYKITIYFSRPKNFQWFPLSWFIRFLESPNKPNLYHSSHACIELDGFIYEAVMFLGVRKIPFSKWRHINEISKEYSIEVSEDEFNNVSSFCEGSIGIPYSFLELFGILYSRFMMAVFNKVVKNPFNLIRRRVKCTEFTLEGASRVSKLNLKTDINNLGVRELETLLLTDKEDIWLMNQSQPENQQENSQPPKPDNP